MKKITLFLFSLVLSFSLNAQYIVDFEGDGETKGAYAPGIVNLSGLDWEMTETLIGTSASDWKNGSRSARFRGYGESEMVMVEDKANGAGNISFEYRRFGSDSQVDWKVEYSVDGGSDWVQVGSVFTAPDSDDVQVFSEQVDVDGDIRFRIKRETEEGSSNRRLNIDDIIITDFGAGDINLTVSSPSEDAVFSPVTESLNVNLGIFNFSLSSSAEENDGDGYIQYSLNQQPFVDVFANSFELVDLSAGETYTLLVKLVDNDGNDLDTPVEVTRNFSIDTFIEVNNITELRADYLENGAGRFYEITGVSTMSHSDDFNNRKWFQDENFSGIMIFDNSSVIAEDAYEVGDQVTNLIGETAVFNGVLQLAPLVDNGVVVGNQMPETQIITISQYLADFQTYESTLIGFQNVSFVDADGSAEFETGQNYDFTDGIDSSIIRSEFFDADYIGAIIPTGTLDGLRGVASQFNGTAQIFPRDLNDIDVVLSINGFEKTQFSLYPNPAKNFVNLEVPAGESFEVNIYNVTGKKVYSTKINGSTRLDINSLQSGMYMINFKQGNQNTTRKLIIN
ncbi:MAG: T9SS type A sorting domain-containing protein [Flavobacteriaceae bacterium]|nr:T9SS type A sorting domain-containing protein [Flavobacteriaceae bacterium]